MGSGLSFGVTCSHFLGPNVLQRDQISAGSWQLAANAGMPGQQTDDIVMTRFLAHRGQKITSSLRSMYVSQTVGSWRSPWLDPHRESSLRCGFNGSWASVLPIPHWFGLEDCTPCMEMCHFHHFQCAHKTLKNIKWRKILSAPYTAIYGIRVHLHLCILTVCNNIK